MHVWHCVYFEPWLSDKGFTFNWSRISTCIIITVLEGKAVTVACLMNVNNKNNKKFTNRYGILKMGHCSSCLD